MTEDDFMRAICDEPRNMDLRLVFADWLDEIGDLRGELIRVQILLSRLAPEPKLYVVDGSELDARCTPILCSDYAVTRGAEVGDRINLAVRGKANAGDTLRGGKTVKRRVSARPRFDQLLVTATGGCGGTELSMDEKSVVWPGYKLQEREKELLLQYPLSRMWYKLQRKLYLHPHMVRIDKEIFFDPYCGLLSKVRCTYEDWHKLTSSILDWTPITRVELTDKQPGYTLSLLGRMYGWHSENPEYMTYSYIHKSIWCYLKDYVYYPGGPNIAAKSYKIYPTPEAAITALSDALIEGKKCSK